MKRCPMLSFLISLCLLAPMTTASAAGEGNSPEFRKEVDSLIRQLRSPNKDPNRTSSPFVRFPEDYDHVAQKKVTEAVAELKSLGKAAFPILIEHANDSEYSQSRSIAILSSASVGQACYDIIQHQVDPSPFNYKNRKGSDGKEHGFHRSYFGKYWKGAQSRRVVLELWWKDNQGKSLLDMQIEALESAIADEEAIGFPSTREKRNYRDPLIKTLDDLKKKKSKTP